MSETKIELPANTARIQDFHPNVRIRRMPAKPLSFIPVNDKEPVYCPPIIDEQGRVFYDVPMSYARRLLASDQLGRYILISPETIQFPQTTNLAMSWKTVTAGKPKSEDLSKEEAPRPSETETPEKAKKGKNTAAFHNPTVGDETLVAQPEVER